MEKICENCGKLIARIYKYREQKYCSQKCTGEGKVKQHTKYTCETCGKMFHANSGKNRYCSYECMHNAPSKLIEVTCIQCTKPFQVTRHRYEHFNTKFCSMACQTAYAWVILPCHVCGKDFRERRCVIKYKQQRNLFGYVFCSLDCLGMWHRVGNHPNWQGGHRKWRGVNWLTQAALARDRDNHTCQECGITEEQIGRPLDVHHKTPWRRFKNDYVAANDLSNLISLCPKCHTTIEARDHRRPPRTRTTQQAQA